MRFDGIVMELLDHLQLGISDCVKCGGTGRTNGGWDCDRCDGRGGRLVQEPDAEARMESYYRTTFPGTNRYD